MAFTDGTLNEVGTFLAGICPSASLHTANPGTTGANETTAGRQAVAFNVDADGDLTLTVTENFTGGAASGPCTYLGIWDADGVTFRGGFILTGDQTFNANGEYSVTGLSVAIASS